MIIPTKVCPHSAGWQINLVDCCKICIEREFRHYRDSQKSKGYQSFGFAESRGYPDRKKRKGIFPGDLIIFFGKANPENFLGKI
jgi:hypothetical protein